MKEGSEYLKAHFFGYMIHWLLLAALEWWELNDHDHFGKKCLNLAGPLLSNLFWMYLAGDLCNVTLSFLGTSKKVPEYLTMKVVEFSKIKPHIISTTHRFYSKSKPTIVQEICCWVQHANRYAAFTDKRQAPQHPTCPLWYWGNVFCCKYSTITIGISPY